MILIPIQLKKIHSCSTTRVSIIIRKVESWIQETEEQKYG